MEDDRCRSLLKCNNDSSRKGEEEEIGRSMAEEGGGGGGLEFHHVSGIRLIIS